MTMTGHFAVHGVRSLVALGLLVAAMSSPILSSTASRTSPPANFLRRNFAILKSGPSSQPLVSAGHSLKTACSSQPDLKDEQDADIEDELNLTSSPAPAPFDIIPSPTPGPHSQLINFATALTARPLRC
jgi:hypothetical protein